MNKNIKNNKLNFTFRIKKNGQVIYRCQTRSKRRFLNRIRTTNWKDGDVRVYLRVSYGKLLSNRRKYENFWNDGEYDNSEDFNLALEAFLEEC